MKKMRRALITLVVLAALVLPIVIEADPATAQETRAIIPSKDREHKQVIAVEATTLQPTISDSWLPRNSSCSGGLSAHEIDRYLQCKNPRSPLIGYGTTFMNAGQKYNVDPRFVVAIAAAESSLGINGDCATQRHNAWGYGGGWPSCWNFRTWEASIEQVTMDIGRYYLPNGQNTIPSFVKSPAGTCTSHCWCASGCTHWVSIVRQVYEEQGGNPNTNDLTFSGNSGSTSGSPPVGYTFCAWEDERCNFSGTADIAYGANGQFAYRQGISGGIDCNNSVFGDPIFGTRKACYIRPVSSGQPDYTPPAGYAFCTWENERCNFSGTADVAYGANGQFAYRQAVSGGIDCNNSVFGDPAFGARKACYIRSQGDRGCTPNADQVALFVDTSYGGQCVLKGSGNYSHPGAIGLPNDSISSLQVGSNTQAILCEHDDYQGVCETFTNNDGDLGDNRIGNDRVSSLRVERRGGAGSPTECPGQYRAEYFANRDLSGAPVLVRCEGWPIRHDWSGGSPGSGVPDDGFSARWTGRARIESGTYTFIARADDGIRVRLGGELLIDAWRDQAPTEYRVTRQVSAGEYAVRVEYYENGGGALAEFRWERANASPQCAGTAINLEQRVEGRLSDAAPSVVYCLRGAAGQMISARMFSLDGESLDTYLRVLTADGRLLAENDDGLNIGYNSFLSVRLPEHGIYRIEATRYGGEGRYALRVEAGFEAAVGDLDRDCDVDSVDQDRLRSLLGRVDPNADLDLDGVVNSRDYIFQMRSLEVRCQ